MTAQAKKNTWMWYVGLLVVVALVAYGIYSWIHGSNTYSPEGNPVVGSRYLSCSSGVVANPFFEFGGASSVEHQIKVTFGKDGPEKVNYRAIGYYGTADEAEKASFNAHAKYNIYMGKNGLDAGLLVPAFNSVGETANISLMADGGLLDANIAPLFLLGVEGATRFSGYSAQELATIYNKIGMSCVINE